MQEELDRSFATLSKADPPVYFISYTVADRQDSEVSGSNGALLSSTEDHARWLEVQTRTGSYQLDDTHSLGDRPPSATSPGTTASLDDYIPVLRNEMWRETDEQYRAASEALIKVKTNQQVQVQTAESARAGFFARRSAHFHRNAGRNSCGPETLGRSRAEIYGGVQQISESVLNSIATFTALAANQYQVNSEGTKLLFGQIHLRLAACQRKDLIAEARRAALAAGWFRGRSARGLA